MIVEVPSRDRTRSSPLVASIAAPVDEVMVASAIYDHEARKRSLAITAEVMSGLTVPA